MLIAPAHQEGSLQAGQSCLGCIIVCNCSIYVVLTSRTEHLISTNVLTKRLMVTLGVSLRQPLSVADDLEKRIRIAQLRPQEAKLILPHLV